MVEDNSEQKKSKRQKDLQEIKQDYEKISQQHKLPKFDSLVEDFDLEKVLEKDNKFLIKDIRRAMGDKFSAYLHLFETLINPSSPPMFVFTFLKNLPEKEKSQIKEAYKELARFQIQSIKLDTIYSEVAEAKFVSDSFEKWQGIKKKVYALVEVFETEFEKSSQEKEKSYFG